MVAVAVLAVAGLASTGGVTVRWGDTLAVIARRHGVSVADLARANGIRDPNRIVAGQRLVIPGTGAGGGGGVHVVRPGETLAVIARRHGTSVAALAAANRIANPNRIYAGARLIVAGASASPPAVAPVAPAPAPTPHVVRPGETLAAIAGRHRTTVKALAAANGIADPNRIRIGQRLRLPPLRSGTQPAGPAWICPVTGARFRDDYGFARAGGRFHEGNDLLAPEGTPVRAPVGGWLVHSMGPVGGLQFKLRGHDGATYFGTHLSRMGKGGPVAAGEVVGYVGATGNARGGRPHLHFEMHPGGRGITNPFPRLVAACT